MLARFTQLTVFLLLQAAFLFFSSGRLDWLWAWVFLGLYVAVLLTNTLILLPRDPDLIRERGRVKEDTKGWDKWLATLVSLVGPSSTLLVAGLDVRWGWSGPLAAPIHLGALAASALGYGVVSWAMVSNRFFAGTVRIQKDRDHRVATAGPYAYVRHPGYVGIALFNLAAPVLLGSSWAMLPAVLTVAVLVLRTALEDRTLQQELKGYRSYTRQVRYRLLPGVW